MKGSFRHSIYMYIFNQIPHEFRVNTLAHLPFAILFVWLPSEKSEMRNENIKSSAQLVLCCCCCCFLLLCGVFVIRSDKFWYGLGFAAYPMLFNDVCQMIAASIFVFIGNHNDYDMWLHYVWTTRMPIDDINIRCTRWPSHSQSHEQDKFTSMHDLYARLHTHSQRIEVSDLMWSVITIELIISAWICVYSVSCWAKCTSISSRSFYNIHI